MKRTLPSISYLISHISYLISLILCLSPAMAAGVKQAQQITLLPGWNAVYVEVTPDETADEIFAAWPVERVGVYDPASYLETKQYSGAENTEGTRGSAYKMWRRGMPALSSLGRVVANQVYVCNNTNMGAYTATLCGRPAAPRITWHPSSTNEAMNFVGISAVPGATNVTINGYFSGFTGGPASFYRFRGFDETIQLTPVFASDKFSDGDVLVASATKVSDWSGVLHVSPMDGVDFSTNVNYHTLSVRNDGATARTVSVTLDKGVAGSIPPPAGLLVRESLGRTNEWISFQSGSIFKKNLGAGETLTLELALDRTKIDKPAGFYYGGVLKIEDASTGDTASHMRVTVPIEATSDGGAGGENAWPKGLWLVSGVFNQVNHLGEDERVEIRDERVEKAGGTVKVRMPMYVDNDGKMTLLQRVTYGTDTNGAVHVYSAAVAGEYPVAIANARRISSAVLPIDQPCIATTNDAAFGGLAVFPFIVGEHARSNPLRHAYHPQHDGVNANFDGYAPSGDNLQNYVTSTVKPELFSITNRIVFAWDGTNGAAWSPDEMCSGTLTWELDGVRHEGTVKMEGAFTMKRISSATLDK